MKIKHSKAFITILIAAGLDAFAALLFAVAEHVPTGIAFYWSVTTATTVGYGDVTPKTGAGHWLAVFVMLTVIPLFAATFSLFTSVLTTERVHKSEERITAHLRHMMHHHGMPEYHHE